MASARIPSALVAALCAALGIGCVPDPPERFVQRPPVLAGLRLHVRDRAALIASYAAALDRWYVATADGFAVVDLAPHAGIAGPDALAHALAVESRSTVIVAGRESLSDGFAATLRDPSHDAPFTVVVRQLGNQWFRCVGDIRLCKTLRRG